MATTVVDICVVYLSEDKNVAEHLVELLRERWSVWWAGDITHGDWEEAVRGAILRSPVLVPVVSRWVKGDRSAIDVRRDRNAESAGGP